MKHNYSYKIIFKTRQNFIHTFNGEASNFDYLKAVTSLFTYSFDKGLWIGGENNYSFPILSLNIALSKYI